MRIKAAIWVGAYVRRINAMAVSAMVGRKGDADAGSIYIKINTLDGFAQVLRPAAAGVDAAAEERFWEPAFKQPRSEPDADAYLLRQRDFDADLWVIEIEDKAGRHFLDDYVIAV
jgi:hypothetical protein